MGHLDWPEDREESRAAAQLDDLQELPNKDIEHDPDAEEAGVGENDEEYPPFKKVFPTMIAIYLAVFLIALVWTRGEPMCLQGTIAEKS